MGMSTTVLGFKPPDAKWHKMKAVYDACKAAEIDPPIDIKLYFNYDKPDGAGVVIEQEDLEECNAIRKYNAESSTGYEVIIDNLPKDVKIVRFYNSW